MLTFKHKGDFSKTTKFLESAKKVFGMKSIFEKYGEMGVRALSDATPRDTGLTAASWYYTINTSRDGSVTKLTFHNSNVQNGVMIAIILQYGHATRNGGYVQGRDYINPAIRPIFDELAEKLWKEVTDK